MKPEHRQHEGFLRLLNFNPLTREQLERRIGVLQGGMDMVDRFMAMGTLTTAADGRLVLTDEAKTDLLIWPVPCPYEGDERYCARCWASHQDAEPYCTSEDYKRRVG